MPSFWNADKLVHFICFAGFGFWVAFACNISSFKKIWLPSLIVSLWAITDEIHQSLIPGRTASVFDWIADTTGAALGTVVFVWLAAKFVKALQKRRN